MQDLKIRKRKVLKIKLAQVLTEEMLSLPREMRDVLLDDLVTAFENRLKALQKRRLNTEMKLIVNNLERYEVLQNS
jgi:hypothetical protein